MPEAWPRPVREAHIPVPELCPRLPVAESFEAEYLEYYRILPLALEDDRLRVAVAGEPNGEALADLEQFYRVPLDPYGRPYIKSPGEANPNAYDLLSLGRGGRPGGTGEGADLRSWDVARPTQGTSTPR